MSDTTPFLKLTSEGAHKIMAAAVAKADEIGIPECISVVDPGGHLICFTKMDGAFVQSIDSSLRKAMTSASSAFFRPICESACRSTLSSSMPKISTPGPA